MSTLPPHPPRIAKSPVIPPIDIAAVVLGLDEIADLLLRYGADPNKKCLAGSTPLVLACYTGIPSCVRLLLGLPGTLRGPMVPTTRPPPPPADPRLCPPGGRHALIQACKCPREEKAEVLAAMLLEKHWRLAVTPDDESMLPAHAAAANGFPRVLVGSAWDERKGEEGGVTVSGNVLMFSIP